MDEWKIGAVVYLKSGSPTMVITDLFQKEDGQGQ